MNTRILELLKKPEAFLLDDFKLVETELQESPFAQSIRALYLYGIKKHSPQYYEQELSKTAAYTTDKKILYQFINGKINPPIIVEEEEVSKVLNQELETIENSIEEDQIEIKSEKEEVEETAIDTLEKQSERTDLKEEKEEVETILEEEKADELDVEADLEKLENQTPQINEEANETEIVSETLATTDLMKKEGSIDENKIEVEQEELTKTEELEEKAEENQKTNFHEETPFMAEVKITKPKESTTTFIPVQQKPNRHELERQRLLEEVEAKMKSKKQNTKKEVELKTETEDIESQEISFAETASFSVKKDEETVVEKQQKEEVIPVEPQPTEEIQETEPVQNPNWKPMSIASKTPDALISKEKKQTETKSKTEITIKEKTKTAPSKSQTTTEESGTEEIPVMNVSFFSPEIKTISEEEEQKAQEETKSTSSESNIPSFINTWQSWLKINRTEEIQQEKEDKETLPVAEETIEKVEEEIKEVEENTKDKVIEKFIQEEPKISKLKDESEYVIKESKEDISHLMTETLAKIYTEQKLYGKAIKGYKKLIEKHPEKEAYFLEKIEEVKSIRSN